MTHFDEDTLNRRSPAQKQVLASLIAWAINRIGDLGAGDIEMLEATDFGVRVHTGYDDYCRGCFMERIRKEYEIPWDVFLSAADLGRWLKDYDAHRAEIERRKREAEERAKREHEDRQREERERAEYLRLKAKFEGGL